MEGSDRNSNTRHGKCPRMLQSCCVKHTLRVSVFLWYSENLEELLLFSLDTPSKTFLGKVALIIT